MRILIFGGDGMLGHRLLAELARRHEVRVALRRELEAYGRYGLFGPENAFGGVDVRDAGAVLRVLDAFRPEAVVNAAGIVKQRPEAAGDAAAIEVNAIFPHFLARACAARGARLVHVSTDCVFSGKKGGYAEADPPDPVDLYGTSKLLGEVERPGALTLRTSMIGPELARKTGLLEWFLSQRGKTVRGFRRAIFSGFTTFELARTIERLLVEFPAASGLYHLAAAPISKHDLLVRINAALALGVTIVPDDEVRCDRSLDGSRFRRDFGYEPPSWEEMIAELARALAGSRV
jgi:dTDP-4-dehydrorhamnose reductase